MQWARGGEAGGGEYERTCLANLNAYEGERPSPAAGPEERDRRAGGTL